MNIKNIQLLIELIEQKKTGTPAELSKKLAVSERMIYKYLDILKSEFNAPIKFNRSIQSYYFTEAGSLDLRWTDGELNN
jgi:transcriptional antiterminator